MADEGGRRNMGTELTKASGRWQGRRPPPPEPWDHQSRIRRLFIDQLGQPHAQVLVTRPEEHWEVFALKSPGMLEWLDSSYLQDMGAILPLPQAREALRTMAVLARDGGELRLGDRFAGD